MIADRLGASGTAAALRRSTDHAVRLNNYAFDLRNTGELEEAEWLMRAALAIDLALRGEGHSKVAHRRNNLGTVLLMRGRDAEAREMVTQAWRGVGARFDLTSARVLAIRLTIAMVDGEPCELFLGQLKSHLAMRPLPDFAEVDRHWQMASVLTVLGPRLGPEARTLLNAIVGILNGNRCVEAAAEIHGWRTTPAGPLDVAWPA